MYQSVDDLLQGLSGNPTAGQPIKDIRGKVWLSHAVWLSGLDPQEFAKTHVTRGRVRSNLARKWEQGLVSPTEVSIAAVEKSLPGTRWIFDLPLWELLRNQPISLMRLKSIADSLTSVDGEVSMWAFPGDDEQIAERCVPAALYPDTEQLVARNDIWGLVGCVLRTRMCEQDRSEGDHVFTSMDMFRILPGALKNIWLRPFAMEIMSALQNLRTRVFPSDMLYDVDEELILRQADDPCYRPWRERRAGDLQTQCFFDTEDPILIAHVIRGAEVRRRRKR
jgi:hypothetical protein